MFSTNRLSKSAQQSLIQGIKKVQKLSTTITSSNRLLSSTSQVSPILQRPDTSLATPSQDTVDVYEDDTFRHILSPLQSRLLEDIKTLLHTIPSELEHLGLTKEDSAFLENASQSLDELFLVVVVGEFNSGKSNFINALLGGKHCKTGVLPTTENVQILRYGPTTQEESKHGNDNKNIRTVYLKADFLKQASLVDTPGTNAVLREHQEITEKFIPSADLILFITSVERPFSESEKQFLTRIYDWKKKVVIVLNKADLVVPDMEAVGIQNTTIDNTINDESNISPIGPDGINLRAIDSVAYSDGTPDTMASFDQITSFVRANAKNVLQQSPPVYGVSSRLALAGKIAIDEANHVLHSDPSSHTTRKRMSAASATAAIAQGRALVANSGFLDLEKHILDELTAENKIRLKLENPLSVAEHLIKKYASTVDTKSNEIQNENKITTVLQRDVEDFKQDTQVSLSRDISKLQAIITQMKSESMQYLTQHLRLGNLFYLLTNLEKTKASYHDKVNRGVSDEIENLVSVMSSWFLSKTSRQAQLLASHLQRNSESTPSSSSGVSVSTENNEKHSHKLSDSSIDPGNAIAQAERLRAMTVDFQQNRTHLYQENQKTIRTLISDDLRTRYSNEMFKKIHKSIYRVVFAQVLAITVLASDIMSGGVLSSVGIPLGGVGVAGLISLGGLTSLPTTKNVVIRESNEFYDTLQKDLTTALNAHFKREVADTTRMLQDSIDPYCKWVQHEAQTTSKLQQRFTSLQNTITKIRKDLITITTKPQATSTIFDAVPVTKITETTQPNKIESSSTN